MTQTYRAAIRSCEAETAPGGPAHRLRTQPRSGAHPKRCPLNRRGVDAEFRQPKPSLPALLVQEQFEVLGVVWLLAEPNVELWLPGHHQFGLTVRTLPGDASRTTP